MTLGAKAVRLWHHALVAQHANAAEALMLWSNPFLSRLGYGGRGDFSAATVRLIGASGRSGGRERSSSESTSAHAGTDRVEPREHPRKAGLTATLGKPPTESQPLAGGGSSQPLYVTASTARAPDDPLGTVQLAVRALRGVDSW